MSAVSAQHRRRVTQACKRTPSSFFATYFDVGLIIPLSSFFVGLIYVTGSGQCRVPAEAR